MDALPEGRDLLERVEVAVVVEQGEFVDFGFHDGAIETMKNLVSGAASQV